MAVNVSVQHNDGFFPGITVDPMLLPCMNDGKPFKFHEEVLYMPPMIPPPSGLRPNVTN